MTKPTIINPSMTPASALMLLILATLWGGSFFLIEIALTSLTPLTIVLWRVGLAVPILLLVLRLQGLRLPSGGRVWGCYLVMGILNNALPFSLIVWGQTQIEGGLAAILNSTTAFFGAVVAGLLLADEPLHPSKVVGALMGLAGVAVIMGPELLGGLDLRNLAQLAVLGAAFSYALASVWGRVTLAGHPPQVNSAGMLICSSLLIIPIALMVDGVPQLDLPYQVWLALLGLSILSTVVGYLLYFSILERAGAANLLLVTLMVPPFSVALGVAFLDERLSAGAFAGFALIGLGLVVTDGRLHRRLFGQA
ncbi:MAG: DMT family transporter [Pseudomonadales bacterium]